MFQSKCELSLLYPRTPPDRSTVFTGQGEVSVGHFEMGWGGGLKKGVGDSPGYCSVLMSPGYSPESGIGTCTHRHSHAQTCARKYCGSKQASTIAACAGCCCWIFLLLFLHNVKKNPYEINVSHKHTEQSGVLLVLSVCKQHFI